MNFLLDSKTALTKLQQLDSACAVFGANHHRYQYTPAKEQEIASVETALGVELPREYRQFLTELGHGAGPYYGIWSPAKVLEEFTNEVEAYRQEEGDFLRASDPFPFGPNQASSKIVESPYPCSGCIPICHQGCTYWTVIVTSGELRGKVWDVACFLEFEGQWVPSRRPPGLTEGRPDINLPALPLPPTFGEWYQGWIERCFAELGSLES